MNGRKIALIVGIVVVLLVIVGFTVQQSQKNVVSVQTAKVGATDLTSTVTGSGQIKPKTYVNIGANAFGKITRLYVHEGDKVKRGQTLAQLENVQSAADVAANQAATQASRTDAVAANAALNTSNADLKRAQSDLERTRLDYERAQELFKAQLIPKSDFETRKAAYDSAAAGLAQADARIAQAGAQKDSAVRRITPASACRTLTSLVLTK